MSKTKIISVALLLVGLAGLSLYLNRDWFAPDTIQISHRLSPWMQNKRPGARANPNDLGVPVTFMLNGFYRLKSVRVVDAANFETNKYAVPVWRINSDSNSIPTSSFNYGSPIRGMKPEAKGVRPEPLQPGVTYRLLVVTDKDLKGQHDFIVHTNN
jgi:hypothetical protein